MTCSMWVYSVHQGSYYQPNISSVLLYDERREDWREYSQAETHVSDYSDTARILWAVKHWLESEDVCSLAVLLGTLF